MAFLWVSIMVEPDITGFREAQSKLRTLLGQDIVFHVQAEKVWGPDVAIDPEQGEPYDPTSVPESGGEITDVTVRASVVFRPLARTPEDEVTTSPVGLMGTQVVALDIAPADYLAIEDAIEFILNGRTFHITDITPDGLTSVDRFIVYGQAQ